MELRTRAQLHALAMDLMKHPNSVLISALQGSTADGDPDVAGTMATGSHATSQGRRRSSLVDSRINGGRLSVADLQDPRLRRILLRKLRQQNALDLAR